jgi:hypothetical protein
VTSIQAAPFAGVSLADEDALLVGPERVEVHGTDARSFSANIGAVAPGYLDGDGAVERGVASEEDEAHATRAISRSTAIPGASAARRRSSTGVVDRCRRGTDLSE